MEERYVPVVTNSNQYLSNHISEKRTERARYINSGSKRILESQTRCKLNRNQAGVLKQ
jgi:hypothetical protein